MVYQRFPNGKLPSVNPGSVINPTGWRSDTVFLALTAVFGRLNFRHPHGWRHKLATVLATYVLTRLAGKVGCDATSRYAGTMPHEHFAEVGGIGSAAASSRLREPRSTGVTVQADRDKVQEAANRWAQAHPVPDRSTLTADQTS